MPIVKRTKITNMSCVKQTKGRYIKEGRKSPPYSAQDCKGRIQIGQDEEIWISIPDKNLKYTWKPLNGAAHNKAVREGTIPLIASEEDLEVYKEYDKLKKKSPVSGKAGWSCEGGKCRRVPKNGNGKKAVSAPPKGILKKPRSKSKEKKTVTRINGKGKRNGNGNGLPLEKYTIVQLRQKAKAKGLKGYSGKNKAALIAMLRNGNGNGSSKKSNVKKPVKKSSGKKQTPAQARKSAGYTKKKGTVGQTLYYKNGKRVAKKNVPVKYQ